MFYRDDTIGATRIVRVAITAPCFWGAELEKPTGKKNGSFSEENAPKSITDLQFFHQLINWIQI